jgi:hypothetical protein
MNRIDYEMTQQQIVFIGSLIKGLPLDEFIAAIDHADSIGPILDPTLWMRGNKEMMKIRDLAAGLRDFQTIVNKIIQEGGYSLGENQNE